MTFAQSMQDLFTTTATGVPLAERMRPRTIDDVVGQSHLLGSGKPLRVAFESGRPHSMILWGPPGVGKTTLARLMADAFGLNFIAISAVLGGVKDIRDAVERAQVTRAQSGKPTVVFVDEVHRFNKAQQDAFLPHVESGLFVFVGATTENPSFEVIGALLSRAAVYVLQPLSRDELETLLDRALAAEPERLTVDAQARSMLFDLADGDARRLLNALEVVGNAARDQEPLLDQRRFLTRLIAGHAAPVRQRRRKFLRPDLSVAQIGARLRPRRVAVLDGAHVRRRGRSALRRAPRDKNGG